MHWKYKNIAKNETRISFKSFRNLVLKIKLHIEAVWSTDRFPRSWWFALFTTVFLQCRWNGLSDNFDLQRDLVGRRGDHLRHLLPLCRLHEEQVSSWAAYFAWTISRLKTIFEIKMVSRPLSSPKCHTCSWRAGGQPILPAEPSLSDPTYVAGACHPWAVHRTQNTHILQTPVQLLLGIVIGNCN